MEQKTPSSSCSLLREQKHERHVKSEMIYKCDVIKMSCWNLWRTWSKNAKPSFCIHSHAKSYAKKLHDFYNKIKIKTIYYFHAMISEIDIWLWWRFVLSVVSDRPNRTAGTRTVPRRPCDDAIQNEGISNKESFVYLKKRLNIETKKKIICRCLSPWGLRKNIVFTIYNPCQHMTRVIHHLVNVQRAWLLYHPVSGLLCSAENRLTLSHDLTDRQSGWVYFVP